MNINYLLIILGLSLLCAGCIKENAVMSPNAKEEIETLQAINVFHDRATLLAAYDPSQDDIIEKGFYFSALPISENTPGDKLIVENSDSARFRIQVTGLEKDKAYYVKAFLKKSSGEMMFGRDISFNTDRMEILDPDAPSGTVSVFNAKTIMVSLTSGSLGDQMLSDEDKKTRRLK